MVANIYKYITQSIIPYITDLDKENVIVSKSTLGSLNTYVIDKGVSATFSGWSTIRIDLIVPLWILFEIDLNYLIDLLENPLMDWGRDNKA